MSDYLIGLTGGIASGKSALEREFVALGVTVADADAIAREIVEPGQPALDEIAARFGTNMLDAEGRLDRAAMRRRVFADPAERKALEAITHPRIRQRLEQRCRQAAGPYAVAMIPLLAEGSGRDSYPWLDRILVVDVPVGTQQARLMQRDGIDAALAERMIASQASRERRLAIADDIVVNDGDPEHLRTAAAGLDALYRRLAATRQERRKPR
ncbi:dephospho-CoA kinase [Pseudoxanthomonas kalamensis DSM 18571]|uniref:dephospho-CoA kinase n=1 Tax=Pseudoxanthomonas kalamensis TaxID=289483 RepID=UPI001391FC85|nr:dephospho-CoA kinase [Pseudoxanthomonas kalamensis]KAF1708833.1 dephospho-CoA kinase [Pseudoxanthomonas kalamensis DSM 18571]